MNVIHVQRLLATCVETLIREGLEAEVNEAIRQGRVVAARLGPYAKDDDEMAAAREAAIRKRALAEAGLLDTSDPIEI